MEINKVYQGDCIEIMKELDDNSFDIIICDLPYNKTKFGWDVSIDLDSLWTHYNRLIKDDGCIILFGKHPFTAKLVLSNLDMFKYELIWEKSRASNNMLVKRQPSAIHENILIFYKNQPTYNELKFFVDEKYVDKRKSINNSYYKNGHYTGVMKRKADDGSRHPQSVLPFNSEWNKNMHPTQKPVALFKYLIETYSNKNDLVLDNCIGSGTTAIACLKSDRNFIGIEKEIEYVKLANKRIEDVFKCPPLIKKKQKWKMKYKIITKRGVCKLFIQPTLLIEYKQGRIKNGKN